MWSIVQVNVKDNMNKFKQKHVVAHCEFSEKLLNKYLTEKKTLDFQIYVCMHRR